MNRFAAAGQIGRNPTGFDTGLIRAYRGHIEVCVGYVWGYYEVTS